MSSSQRFYAQLGSSTLLLPANNQAEAAWQARALSVILQEDVTVFRGKSDTLKYTVQKKSLGQFAVQFPLAQQYENRFGHETGPIEIFRNMPDFGWFQTNPGEIDLEDLKGNVTLFAKIIHRPAKIVELGSNNILCYVSGKDGKRIKNEPDLESSLYWGDWLSVRKIERRSLLQIGKRPLSES